MIGDYSIMQLVIYTGAGVWLFLKIHWEWRKRRIVRDEILGSIEDDWRKQVEVLRRELAAIREAPKPTTPQEPTHLHWSTPVTDMHGEPIPDRHLCVDCLEECSKSVLMELPNGIEVAIESVQGKFQGVYDDPHCWLRIKGDPTPIKATRVTFQDGRVGHKFEQEGKDLLGVHSSFLVVDGKIRQVQTSVRN